MKEGERFRLEFVQYQTPNKWFVTHDESYIKNALDPNSRST